MTRLLRWDNEWVHGITADLIIDYLNNSLSCYVADFALTLDVACFEGALISVNSLSPSHHPLEYSVSKIVCSLYISIRYVFV